MLLRKSVLTLVTLVALGLSQMASAQYMPPSPSPAPGTPGYTPTSKSYGANKAAIGAGAGAAAGAGVLYLVMRNRGVYTGCVGPDGTFTNAKDGRKFHLQSTSVQPGEKVSIKTKKADSDPSGSSLEVVKVRKDLGPCEQQTASTR